MTETVVINGTELVISTANTFELVEVSTQGPPGPPGAAGADGPPGPIGDAAGAFLVTARLAEIAADTTAQAQARANLGIAVWDGGTFF